MARVMGRGEWGLLALLSVLWGGSFFFAEIAVEALPPLTLAFGRVALAALALILVLWASGGRMPRDRRLLAAFAVMGFSTTSCPSA